MGGVGGPAAVGGRRDELAVQQDRRPLNAAVRDCGDDLLKTSLDHLHAIRQRRQLGNYMRGALVPGLGLQNYATTAPVNHRRRTSRETPVSQPAMPWQKRPEGSWVSTARRSIFASAKLHPPRLPHLVVLATTGRPALQHDCRGVLHVDRDLPCRRLRLRDRLRMIGHPSPTASLAPASRPPVTHAGATTEPPDRSSPMWHSISQYPAGPACPWPSQAPWIKAAASSRRRMCSMQPTGRRGIERRTRLSSGSSRNDGTTHPIPQLKELDKGRKLL